MSAAGAPPPSGDPVAPVRSYVAATTLTVATILSQYLVPYWFPATLVVYRSLVGGFLLIYGVPILTFSLLVGTRPLRNWASRLRTAALEGVRWYGVLTVLALVLGTIILAVLAVVDPASVSRSVLSRPTPVLQGAKSDPWLWVGLSFVIGPLEETIFRGWIFGYWLDRDPANWRYPLIGSSALFAGVHVYYATTYGIVVLVPAVALFLVGVGFALAVQRSGGNLLAVSLIHGWNDATVFVVLAVAPLGLALHYGLVLVGAVIALVLYWSVPGPTPPPAQTPVWPPPPGAPPSS